MGPGSRQGGKAGGEPSHPLRPPDSRDRWQRWSAPAVRGGPSGPGSPPATWPSRLPQVHGSHRRLVLSAPRTTHRETEAQRRKGCVRSGRGREATQCSAGSSEPHSGPGSRGVQGPLTAALADPGGLAVPASYPCVRGQTHVPGAFSWLAVGSLQALGGWALGAPGAGGLSAPGLTALPRVGDGEAPPAAQGHGSVGKGAGSGAARSCETGGPGSGGRRRPGEAQAAEPRSSRRKHPLRRILPCLPSPRGAHARPLRAPGLLAGPPGLLEQSPWALVSALQSPQHPPHQGAFLRLPWAGGPHPPPHCLPAAASLAIPQPPLPTATALLGAPRLPLWPRSPLLSPPGYSRPRCSRPSHSFLPPLQAP